MMAFTTCLLAAAIMFAAVPQANAGATFEIREPVPTGPNATDAYKLVFNVAQPGVVGGSIVRPFAPGQGIFAASLLPLAIFNLDQGRAVGVHIHPNAFEIVFALEGKLRVVQFRGEEDNPNVRTVEIEKGEAAFIQQGSIHFVENIACGPSSFLQIFDHPQAGAVFVGPALVNLKGVGNAVNSNFNKDLPIDLAAVNPLFVNVRSARR